MLKEDMKTHRRILQKGKDIAIWKFSTPPISTHWANYFPIEILVSLSLVKFSGNSFIIIKAVIVDPKSINLENGSKNLYICKLLNKAVISGSGGVMIGKNPLKLAGNFTM